jgi:nucleoside-diphosphate-sugar epimerase
MLVTGAGGFIGRRLCQHLAAAGHSVVACVRRANGLPGQVPIDVADRPAFSALVKSARPQSILHLASAGVAPQRAHDLTVVADNLALADSVVNAAAEIEGCAVVCAGSMAEYGAQDAALHETLPTNPGPTLTSYAIAKLAAGLHARALGHRLGVAVTVARLFGVYGPGEPAHRLFPALLAGLAAGRPVELSDGLQRRDFVHVDDVCTCLITLATRGQGNLLVNIGCGESVVVADVCRRIASMVNADASLLHFGARPRSPGDADLLMADVSVLKAVVGHVPPARLASTSYDSAWFQ